MAGLSGMEMMMKAMGLDKQQIEAELNNFKVLTVNTVTHFDNRLTMVEATLKEILVLLTDDLKLKRELLAAATSTDSATQITNTGE